jgi:hypothetical protein
MANQSFDVKVSSGSDARITAPALPGGAALQIVIDSASAEEGTGKSFKIIVYELDADRCHEVVREWGSMEFLVNYPWQQTNDITVVGVNVFGVAARYSNGSDVLHIKGSLGPCKLAPEPPNCGLQASNEGGAGESSVDQTT